MADEIDQAKEEVVWVRGNECLGSVYCFAFSAALPRLNRAQRDKQERSLLASRANPSYMYQNCVLVVNTRGSSALPKD